MIGKKIAIVGGHGTGKSTLSMDLAAALKKMNYHAGVTGDGARSSPYLIAKEIVSETEVNILGRQITNETDLVRESELVICDGSVLEVVMYCNLFFSNPDESARNCFRGIEDFARRHVDTYDVIFRTTSLYDLDKTKDPLRPKNRELQRRSHELLQKILRDFRTGYEDLPENGEVPFMINILRERNIISN